MPQMTAQASHQHSWPPWQDQVTLTYFHHISSAVVAAKWHVHIVHVWQLTNDHLPNWIQIPEAGSASVFALSYFSSVWPTGKHPNIWWMNEKPTLLGRFWETRLLKNHVLLRVTSPKLHGNGGQHHWQWWWELQVPSPPCGPTLF